MVSYRITNIGYGICDTSLYDFCGVVKSRLVTYDGLRPEYDECHPLVQSHIHENKATEVAATLPKPAFAG